MRGDTDCRLAHMTRADRRRQQTCTSERRVPPLHPGTLAICLAWAVRCGTRALCARTHHARVRRARGGRIDADSEPAYELPRPAGRRVSGGREEPKSRNASAAGRPRRPRTIRLLEDTASRFAGRRSISSGVFDAEQPQESRSGPGPTEAHVVLANLVQLRPGLVGVTLFFTQVLASADDAAQGSKPCRVSGRLP
jgi:hypothetical protein